MEYITHKRFKQKALCGNINIPATTICELVNNVITYRDQAICLVTSENSHKYFARNDDGHGLLRGKLTQSITKCLEKKDTNYQNRWNKVWQDAVCQKYRRQEHNDWWLWSHEFFNASIEDLKHIANIIGVKEADYNVSCYNIIRN